MAYTQEDFQEWIFYISDKMDQFTNEFAKDNLLTIHELHWTIWKDGF